MHISARYCDADLKKKVNVHNFFLHLLHDKLLWRGVYVTARCVMLSVTVRIRQVVVILLT